MTVTVTSQSAVLLTQTEIVKFTEFITITKTVPSDLHPTKTMLSVLPDPSTEIMDPTHLAATKVSTITQTFYSTICESSNENLEEKYFSQLNNYGINPKHLIKNPYYAQSRTLIRRQRFENNAPHFDELYWPKETVKEQEGWMSPSNEDYHEPTTGGTSLEHFYYSSGDLDSQGTLTITKIIPSEEDYRRGRHLIFKDNFSPNYGVPFYGYKRATKEQ